MKTFRIITQLAILASMGLTSCQEYDAGFTAADIFKGTYARKFVEKHGAIDPEETWDLSTAGGRRSGGIATRAAGTYKSVACEDDGYYYLPDEQLNWMKTRLPESTNNSEIMKPFEMFWEKGNVFEVIPIYEGFAQLSWELGIQIMSADGSELYNKSFWWKPNDNGSDKFQVIWNAVPTLASNDEISVFYQTTEPEARIWAWGNDVDFHYDRFEDRPYMTRIGCNGDGNYVYKYTFSGSNKPTHVKFIDGNGGELAFENHGYYYAGGSAYDHTITATYDVRTTYKNKDTWTNFTNINDGSYAAQFRSKPELSTTFLGGKDFPTGSKVLFYLKINGGKDGTPNGTMQFSDKKQMTLLECPRPSNIPEGYKTYILGVEDESLTSNTCDRDYNDIVFLIAGKVPEPVYYTPEPYEKETKKRYMCEDLTGTGDFDFNDIVIDVCQTYKKTFKPTTADSKVYEVDKVTITQKAKVSWLCGTVPLTAKVGNYQFPLITNPSKKSQSITQLHSNKDTYNVGDWFSGSGTTNGYCPMEGEDDWVTITGWDPDANNISIYVCWDGSEATTLENATSIEGGSKVWTSTFPTRGSVPYIIATDIDDPVTNECQDINDTGWWKSHFLWSSPENKQ